ncbi:MAG: dihydroneopterin aldolase [Methanobacteriota archaeon]|nr:MAG: dihydroneopterin aldolase [Euryarchaeota archaeon]
MGDKIVLRGIEFYGYHGLHGEEKRLGGRYSVDVEIFCDLSRAGRSDNVGDTIDYGSVCRLVFEIASTKRFNLLEGLAEAVANAILGRFPVEEVVVRVEKVQPPVGVLLRCAAVEIRRKKPVQT